MQLILFSKKRSHEEFVKVVLREKNCWKKKSLMDRKMEKQLNKKNNFKKQKQKVDAHSELQKRADRADQSVLFFLAGANFWEKHAKNC